MINNLTELETLGKVKEAHILPKIKEYAVSEVVANITYAYNFKVTVLQINQSFSVTYHLGERVWSTNCSSLEAVIADVKGQFKLLRDTKLIPS